MERTVDLVDVSGKVVNRIIIDSDSAWKPPAGHTIRDIADGATFGEPASAIPIPPRDIPTEITTFAVSDDPQAKATRGLARTVLNSVSNVIAKHNALTAILASGRFPTQQEATALTIPVRDFATLMAAVKKAAIDEVNPNT